jgi:hypothetical protein
LICRFQKAFAFVIHPLRDCLVATPSVEDCREIASDALSSSSIPGQAKSLHTMVVDRSVQVCDRLLPPNPKSSLPCVPVMQYESIPIDPGGQKTRTRLIQIAARERASLGTAVRRSFSDFIERYEKEKA